MPCVPTATRGIGIDAWLLQELSEANQARLLVNFMKTEWFVELLRETAAVKWLKEKRIFLDEMAVAQHYGLPTGYIDLTQSFDVAAFFACCRYDPATKSFWNSGLCKCSVPVASLIFEGTSGSTWRFTPVRLWVCPAGSRLPPSMQPVGYVTSLQNSR
jgi:hypothetical protein